VLLMLVLLCLQELLAPLLLLELLLLVLMVLGCCLISCCPMLALCLPELLLLLLRLRGDLCQSLGLCQLSCLIWVVFGPQMRNAIRFNTSPSIPPHLQPSTRIYVVNNILEVRIWVLLRQQCLLHVPLLCVLRLLCTIGDGLERWAWGLWFRWSMELR
jgi:hypothetical protein